MLKHTRLVRRWDRHEDKAEYPPGDPLRATPFSGAEAFLIGPADIDAADLWATDEDRWLSVPEEMVIDLEGAL